VLREPVTVVVNCCVPPVSSATETGEMDTATVGVRAEAPIPNKTRIQANAIARGIQSHFLCMISRNPLLTLHNNQLHLSDTPKSATGAETRPVHTSGPEFPF
jgi:hypothetical protein